MQSVTKATLTKYPLWKEKLLAWLDLHYPYFCFQTGHQYDYPEGTFPQQASAARSKITQEEAFATYGKCSMAGLVGYDFKNQVEKLKSENKTLLELEDTVFFKPDITIYIEKEVLVFAGENAEEALKSFENFKGQINSNPDVKVTPLSDEEAYTKNVKAIQNHIEEGDVYELNYCMSFTFGKSDWSPIKGFLDLTGKSPMPFSGIFKADEKYLLSASPERFLKKSGKKLIAQPIKGTIKRGKTEEEDEALKSLLFQSEKERAENLMIVDLMRNDLSKISHTGSVQVDELFGVYAFPKVHQMISTVSSKAQKALDLKELLHATFPMGSMTGAPKIRCMELIEKYEDFKRGWFSGSFGYFEANGDFDLNVVIRSIIFDKRAGEGYFAVGSAITYDADPEYEYQECLLKASAIMEILKGG